MHLLHGVEGLRCDGRPQQREEDEPHNSQPPEVGWPVQRCLCRCAWPITNQQFSQILQRNAGHSIAIAALGIISIKIEGAWHCDDVEPRNARAYVLGVG